MENINLDAQIRRIIVELLDKESESIAPNHVCRDKSSELRQNRLYVLIDDSLSDYSLLDNLPKLKRDYHILGVKTDDYLCLKNEDYFDEIICISPEKIRIRPHDYFLVPMLSQSDLAKIALGIADNSLTKWFAFLLDRNIKVHLYREGLLRSYENKRYSALFVGYERTILEYGVAIVAKNLFLKTIQKNMNQNHGILTLTDIRSLPDNSELSVKSNTVLTMSAKDAIEEKNIRLIKQ